MRDEIEYEREWMDFEQIILNFFNVHFVFPKPERESFNGQIQTSTQGCIKTSVGPRHFCFLDLLSIKNKIS